MDMVKWWLGYCRKSSTDLVVRGKGTYKVAGRMGSV
jgi:hypothetical protein